LTRTDESFVTGCVLTARDGFRRDAGAAAIAPQSPFIRRAVASASLN
jgi:hypothetical protein